MYEHATIAVRGGAEVRETPRAGSGDLSYAANYVQRQDKAKQPGKRLINQSIPQPSIRDAQRMRLGGSGASLCLTESTGWEHSPPGRREWRGKREDETGMRLREREEGREGGRQLMRRAPQLSVPWSEDCLALFCFRDRDRE